MRRLMVTAAVVASVLAGLAPVAPAQAAPTPTLHWASELLGSAAAPTTSLLVERTDVDATNQISACPTQSGAAPTDRLDLKLGPCGGFLTQLTLKAAAGTLFATGAVITYDVPGSISSMTASPVQPAALTCTNRPVRATLTVLAATHDGSGALTSLAADYVVECGTVPSWTGRAAGSVRWNSALPYAVTGVDAATYIAPPAMPSENTEQVVLPVTVLGTGSVHVTGVALADKSSKTTYASDTCTGHDVSAVASCSVTVTVSSIGSGYDAQPGAAYVDLALSDGRVVHVSRPFGMRLPLSSVATLPFPTAGGIGVGVSGNAEFGDDHIRVLRRLHGTSEWTTIADALAQPSSQQDLPVFVDTTAVAGTAYDYATQRVTASTPPYATWTSPLDIATMTLPEQLPVPTSRTRILARDEIAGSTLPVPFTADTDAGLTTTVTAHGTTTNVLLTDGSGTTVASVDLPVLAGPGSYVLGAVARPVSLGLGQTQCYSAGGDTVLVRSALYGGSGDLQALDASLRMDCNGFHRDVEIRVRAGGGVATPFVSPTSATALADPGADAAPTALTVTNPGPDTVTVGTPTTAGAGASDWSIGPCSATTLAAGQSCTTSITFHGASTPATRPATAVVPVSVGAAALPDLTVALTGRTTDVPTAPTLAAARYEPRRVVVDWHAPADDGGRAVTSYVVERSTTATPAWSAVSTQDAVTGLNRFVDDVAPSDLLRYRITAVSSRGAGAPTAALQPVLDDAPAVSVGTLSERSADAPWSLFLAGPFWTDAPLLLDGGGREHESPSATPDGRAVVFSRAATPGAGQVDYDLYRLGLVPGSNPVRLTDTPGAELDAATSPDMTTLAFTHLSFSASSSASEICLMPAGTSTVTAPSACLAGFSHPSWLSAHVLVASDDRTDTGTIVRIPVAAGAFGAVTPLVGSPSTVPMAGAFDPSANVDGSRVAFVDGNGDPAMWSADCDCTWSPMVTSTAQSFDWALPTWGTATTALWASSSLDTLTALGSVDAQGSGYDGAQISAIPAPDTVAPVIGAVGPAYVRSGGTVAIAVTDAGSPKGGVPVACSVDGGTAVPCSDGFSTTGTAVGHHTLRVVATDVSGNVSVPKDVAFTVDDTAPAAAALVLPAYSLTSSVTATFSAADALSPVTYDVRWRTWPPTQTAPNGYAGTVTGLAGTSKAFSLSSGRVCVQVRGRDAAGNVGAWGVERCSTRPVDDRALRTLDKGWTRVTGSAFLNGTATYAKRTGIRLVSLTGLSASRFVVVATACPTCGSVAIYHGGVRVGLLNLHASTTTVRKVLLLSASRYRYAQLELRTASSGLVRIDAVIPLR